MSIWCVLQFCVGSNFCKNKCDCILCNDLNLPSNSKFLQHDHDLHADLHVHKTIPKSKTVTECDDRTFTATLKPHLAMKCLFLWVLPLGEFMVQQWNFCFRLDFAFQCCPWVTSILWKSLIHSQWNTCCGASVEVIHSSTSFIALLFLSLKVTNMSCGAVLTSHACRI